MKACKTQTYSLLAVALLVLSSSWACRLPGTACEEDADCPEDGLCDSTVCVQRCSTTADCDGTGVCDADGRCIADGHDAGRNDAGSSDAGSYDAGLDAGPDDTDSGTDAGPDDIAVTLLADLAAVNAGASVTLTWSSTPLADDCQLEERVGAGSYSQVGGAPTTAADSFTVAPLVTTDYRVTCSSALGTGDATATVDVASLTNLSVTPEALGPAAEQVTLDFSYAGPGDCTVSGPADEQAAVAGHQVTLSATTTLTITCEGHGADLVASIEVPQLMTSFTASAAIVDYGAQADLAWELEDGATTTCTINGSAATSPHSVTFTESGDHELECTRDGTSATATVFVSVRPGFVGAELMGTLSKDAPTDPEASLVLLATPTLNATACSVTASHFATPQQMVLSSVETDHQVFELDVARSVGEGPSADGVMSYTVECESDVDVSAASLAEVIVWWGGLTSTDLGGFETSGATLVTMSVDLGGVSDASPLATLVEIGGALELQNTAFARPVGLEALERVLGTLFVLSNTDLEDTVGGNSAGLVGLRFVGGDVLIGGPGQLNPLLDTALLPALEEIGGGLTISSNAALNTISMSALSSVTGGGLTISSNAALNTISMSALSSVGGGLTISSCPLLREGASSAEGFDALDSIDGSFTVSDTALDSLSSYFGVLSEVTGTTFSVTSNSALPCADAATLYCSVGLPRPAPVIANNAASCSVTPSCQ